MLINYSDMGTLKALLTSILLQQTWLLLSRNSKQQSSSLHFNVTLKLIASNLTCNHLAPSLLCTLLEIELPRLIITDPNLTDVPEKFNIFQNFRTHQNFSAVLPPIGALRFSPHAENAFVDLQSSLEAVDITQVSQLGTEAELRACFEMQSMKVLKHKMGIVVDSTMPHHFTKVLIEKYIENSRESTVIPISVTNFRESNHDKFALLRRCRFIVQSYHRRSPKQFGRPSPPDPRFQNCWAAQPGPFAFLNPSARPLLPVSKFSKGCPPGGPPVGSRAPDGRMGT